jgi:hypothetical protein
VPAAGEAADVRDVTDQPGLAGEADPVQVFQITAGRLDEFVGAFGFLVDLDESC